MANAPFYLSPVLFANVYGIDAKWIGYALIPRRPRLTLSSGGNPASR